MSTSECAAAVSDRPAPVSLAMSNALNFALYYAGWFACILGPAWGRPWTGTLLAVVLIGCHLALARRRRDELALMLWAAAIGAAVDSAQIALGTLRFPIGALVPWLPPPWLIVLWAQFAATFHFSMRWLKGRPALAAFFGAVGGPLAFLAGSRLGVVELHDGVWPSLVSLAIVWSAVMPALMALAARQDGREGCGAYRVELGALWRVHLGSDAERAALKEPERH